MKRILASITIAIISTTIAIAQNQTNHFNDANEKQKLSLSQFKNMVMDYSMQIKMSQEQINAAENKFKATRTGYYPSLSATADANYMTNLPFDIPGMNLKNYTYGAALLLQQNIYAGHAVKNKTEVARIEHNIAKVGKELTAENVLYGAEITYVTLAASEKQFVITTQYIEIIQNLYRIVKERFDDGLISKTDLLMVETRLNEANLQQLAAQKLYRVSMQNLNNMVGQSQTVNYQIVDTIGSPNNFPRMASIEFALENRHDYEISNLKIDLAKRNERLVKSKFNPQIVGGVSGNWGTGSMNLGGDDKLYGVVYASLRTPIFNWLERKKTLGAAKAASQSQVFALEDNKNVITSEFQNAITSLEQSFKQAEIAQKNLEIAQENLELNTYSYNEGRLPILDVLSAQLSWIQSFTASVNSNFHYKVAYADYRKSIGMMQFNNSTDKL